MNIKEIIKKIEAFDENAARKAEMYAKKSLGDFDKLLEYDFGEGILCLFVWRETEEGEDYWNDINNRLRNRIRYF